MIAYEGGNHSNSVHVVVDYQGEQTSTLDIPGFPDFLERLVTGDVGAAVFGGMMQEISAAHSDSPLADFVVFGDVDSANGARFQAPWVMAASYDQMAEPMASAYGAHLKPAATISGPAFLQN